MDKRIKILVPIRYPLGGIRTHLKYTYGKLAASKYTFTLVAPERKWLKLIKSDLPKHEIKLVVPKGEHITLKMALCLVKLCVRSHFDIIHSHGYTAGVIASIVNSLFRIPHLITLHHVFRADQASDTFWEKYSSLKGFVLGRVLCTADVIQPVSMDAKDNLLETFPVLEKRLERIRVIPNGIELDSYIDSFTNGESTNDEFGNEFIVGFFGRYMPEKGFLHLIDVVEHLVRNRTVREFKILSVGGFGGFIREYRKEIERRGLTEYFEFLGFFQNIYRLLKQVHVVVVPSLGEAGPLLPMEALIAGTPIIAFSCIGLREILAGTPAVLVPVGDSRAMAEELVKMKNDYDTVKHEFEAFVQSAMRRYDVSASARKLDEVFCTLLRKKGVGA